MLCHRNGARTNGCHSGILLIRDKILGFNERSDYMNYVEAVILQQHLYYQIENQKRSLNGLFFFGYKIREIYKWYYERI